MKTKLIEFKNEEAQLLRGIITLPDNEIKKAAICPHGFERAGTTEKKFKILADELTKEAIATLRFDFSGSGLSDGDFKLTTIEKQSKEFLNAIKICKKELGDQKINIITHSLGSCVLADQIVNIKEQIEKIVLIAPALNQKDLLRYRFTIGQMKNINPKIEITRDNYQKYLKEEEFQKDCKKENKTSKKNYINPEYFLSAKDSDFSNNFNKYNDKTLHIHGTNDKSVPLESISTKFNNQIIIENGDHDLEKPKRTNQWLGETINFLIR